MPTPTPVSSVPQIDCHADAALAPKPLLPGKKKIFVFCDGTGNKFTDQRSSKDANSNVVKLYTALRVADDQVAYYHPGVGTMGDPSIRFALPRWWSKVKGLAFGAGFKSTVLDAYRYLMETYNDGDDIYIFGFSRGSYTARALAAMLHGYGLLCRGNEGHLLYAWNMFHDEMQIKRNLLKKKLKDRGAESGHSIKPNLAFAETYSRLVTVRFMGLWDTVTSVGWVYEPLRLLSMARNPIIQVGRHAVSIDEKRAYYRDNLWGDPFAFTDPEWPEVFRKQGIQQDIAQVWFPGAHSDVGGSYPQAETDPANEALRWMIDELQNNGAALCQERVGMVLGTPSGVCAADAIYCPPPEKGHCLHDSLTWEWWPLQLFAQQYYDKDDGEIQWRTPYWTRRTIPDGAIIHGSAMERLGKPMCNGKVYDPKNLTNKQLGELTEGTVPTFPTTALLDGCWTYKLKVPQPTRSELLRLLKFGAGLITFGLFAGSFLAIAVYVVSFSAWLIALTLKLIVLHIPGIARLAHWLVHWSGCVRK